MKDSVMNKNLNVDVYEEYINKIVDIFRLSSKKSSILFDIKIENYRASILLSLLNQNGSREKFRDVVLNCDYAFYHDFLLNLVKNVYQCGNISTTDIVHLSESDLVTFRMITTNNDLFSIDGLSMDNANSLLNICKNSAEDKTNLKISNHRGVGSLYIFVFLISILIILFLFLVFILHS